MWLNSSSLEVQGVQYPPVSHICYKILAFYSTRWLFLRLIMNPAKANHFMASAVSSKTWLTISPYTVILSKYTMTGKVQSPAFPFRTLSTTYWKCAGAYVRPIGILIHLYFPSGVTKVEL